MVWCAWILACSKNEAPPPPVEAPAPVEVTGLGWISEVAWHPDRFQALTAQDQDGWVALQANDPARAWGAFTSAVGKARAAWELGVLHQDLARLSADVNEELWRTWSAHGGMPPEGAMLAAISAACHGDESATSWASKVPPGPDRPLADAIVQGRNPTDLTTNGPMGKRLGQHHRAEDARDAEALVELASTPVVERTEKVGGKDVERKFWDPCLHEALSDTWFGRSADAVKRGPGWKAVAGFADADAGLAGTLLAPWLTAEDLTAELAIVSEPGALGARAATVRRLGVGAAAFPTDDPAQAREEVSVLDAGLAAWDKRIADEAPSEGAAVVHDLGLVARFRQEWLLARARAALDEDQPKVAGTLLELARDHASEGISAANDPALYALLADSELRDGHTREALQALQVLADAYPEVLGVRETLSDLAILQGLDRDGVSLEDP